MKVREVIRLLGHNGWQHVRTTGSHRQSQHSVKRGTVALAEAEGLIREANEFHLEDLRADGAPCGSAHARPKVSGGFQLADASPFN
jgi:hypothetical protein